MDSFLSVQPGLLIWSAINFMFFLVALYLIGGKSFINNISNRENLIQDAINTAEEQKIIEEKLDQEKDKQLIEKYLQKLPQN